MMITISTAKSTELPEIISLLQSVRGDTNNIDHRQFVIAKYDNKLVGCIRIKELDKDCLELASMAVVDEYSSRGIGSKLIAKILDTEQRRPVYLLCFTDKKVFYERSGFEIIPVNSLPSILKKEYERVFEKLKSTKLEIIAMAHR